MIVQTKKNVGNWKREARLKRKSGLGVRSSKKVKVAKRKLGEEGVANDDVKLRKTKEFLFDKLGSVEAVEQPRPDQ